MQSDADSYTNLTVTKAQDLQFKAFAQRQSMKKIFFSTSERVRSTTVVQKWETPYILTLLVECWDGMLEV